MTLQKCDCRGSMMALEQYQLWCSRNNTNMAVSSRASSMRFQRWNCDLYSELRMLMIRHNVVTIRDWLTTSYESVKRWYILLWKPNVQVISTLFFAMSWCSYYPQLFSVTEMSLVGGCKCLPHPWMLGSKLLLPLLCSIYHRATLIFLFHMLGFLQRWGKSV